MKKNKWFLNGGRGSGRTIRLLCETYENKIADLEKENAEQKAQLESERDLPAIAYMQGAEKQKRKDKEDCVAKLLELEKENAELKRDKEDLIFIRNQNAKCMCEDKERFTKAKELLKQWLQTSNASSCDNINIVTDTEQFLNEVEK